MARRGPSRGWRFLLATLALAVAALLPRVAAQGQQAAEKGAYVPTNIVEAFILCPVRNPRRWDPSVFDPTLTGFTELLWRAAELAPPSYFAAAGPLCSPRVIESLLQPCTTDDYGGRPGNVTSLSTSDGCCGAACAAEVRRKDARCLGLVYQLLCADPLVSSFAAGVANALARCGNVSVECRAGSLSEAAAAVAAEAAAEAEAEAGRARRGGAGAEVPLTGVFAPERVVGRWEDCPVERPRAWDPAVFNSTEAAVIGVLARYRSRLSQECALLGPSTLLPCASDGAGATAAPGAPFGEAAEGAGAAGGGASFSTVDGCCHASCAASVVRDRRCLSELYQLACADPATQGFALGLSNALVRCANLRLDCAAARAGLEPAAPSHLSENVVDVWGDCPVESPTPWDLREFDSAALTSRYGGLVSLYESLNPRDPKPLLQRVGRACQEPLVLALSVCASDNDRRGDPAAARASFSTLDGCCSRGCAGRLRQVIDSGCWAELERLLCNASLALPAGGAWLELPESDPRRLALRALSYGELRVAYDISFLTRTFGAGIYNGLIRCANYTSPCILPPPPDRAAAAAAAAGAPRRGLSASTIVAICIGCASAVALAAGVVAAHILLRRARRTRTIVFVPSSLLRSPTAFFRAASGALLRSAPAVLLRSPTAFFRAAAAAAAAAPGALVRASSGALWRGSSGALFRGASGGLERGASGLLRHPFPEEGPCHGDFKTESAVLSASTARVVVIVEPHPPTPRAADACADGGALEAAAEADAEAEAEAEAGPGAGAAPGAPAAGGGSCRGGAAGGGLGEGEEAAAAGGGAEEPAAAALGPPPGEGEGAAAVKDGEEEGRPGGAGGDGARGEAEV
ncbi:hypothetical protein Rsub_09348 [Raphidocelis subcapitata]|uniref:VDE lipocalin domain-containing protein n=1 Tax=Raphidocelis subcapitata TaxID=307507 RepID=A0A2V0PCD8_9CHLO|nr:hypothetical protein Rsub_09348 [Raphidocelis subcapitata]|eukprot:GBF96602.1 hypothetical protein Rsub_09348 [Raphidocelis subcapitata]